MRHVRVPHNQLTGFTRAPCAHRRGIHGPYPRAVNFEILYVRGPSSRAPVHTAGEPRVPCRRRNKRLQMGVIVVMLTIFWATVCKTVRPTLSDRCLSVRLRPVCLSVTLVYCGQTAGWIKMSLGTEVGPGPPKRRCVRWDPAPPR